jgi:hypothetical protein
MHLGARKVGTNDRRRKDETGYADQGGDTRQSSPLGKFGD